MGHWASAYRSSKKRNTLYNKNAPWPHLFQPHQSKIKKYVLPEKDMSEVSKFVRKKFSAYLN